MMDTLQEQVESIEIQIKQLFQEREKLLFKMMLGIEDSTVEVPDNVVPFPHPRTMQ